MRIFALETDSTVLKQEFLAPGETEVLMTRYHWFSFIFAIIRDLFLTALLIAIGFAVVQYGQAPVSWTIGILFVVWFFFIFFRLLRVTIDWLYDFIWVTSDKVLFVDQTSIFRREIRPVSMESIVGVGTKTQFWNILPFGILTVYLDQGSGGGSITKKYVPRAEKVAGTVSDLVTKYQRLDHMPEGGAA